MSPVIPVSPSESPRQPDDVDGLLRDFFQSALPHEWPAPPLPTPAVRHGFFQARSRFTLAASVAFLLGGSLWLSMSYPGREDASFRPARGVPTEARRPVSRLQNSSLDSTRGKRPHPAVDTRR